jgi:hypothetical protein
MSYDNLNSVSQNVLKFFQQLTDEERRVPFIFDRNNQVMEIGWKDVGSGGYILVSCAHSNTSILCRCMMLIYGRTLFQVAILMNWFIINLTHFCDKVSLNKLCTIIPQQCYCENGL